MLSQQPIANLWSLISLLCFKASSVSWEQISNAKMLIECMTINTQRRSGWYEILFVNNMKWHNFLEIQLRNSGTTNQRSSAVTACFEYSVWYFWRSVQILMQILYNRREERNKQAGGFSGNVVFVFAMRIDASEPFLCVVQYHSCICCKNLKRMHSKKLKNA